MAENEPEELSLYYESENNRLQYCLAHNQNVFCEASKPPAWLTEAEYPMKWLMSLSFRLVVHCNIPDKLRDYKNQGAEYGFEKFCYMMTMLFLNSRIVYDVPSDEDESSVSEEESDPNNSQTSEPNNSQTSEPNNSQSSEPNNSQSSEPNNSQTSDPNNSQTREPNNTGEEKPKKPPLFEYHPEKAYTLCREILDEMASHEGDVMYSRIGAALEYVLTATRAHMLFWKGDIATSQEMAKNLQPVAEMNNETRAGFEGIKGKFILSFYKDPNEALQASLKAIEMDPTFGAWYYQAGKVIRRLRRENRTEITLQELKYFEKAVELERNPKYLIYLAQAYQEMSQCMFKNKEAKEEINNMQKKAAELYRETWGIQNNAVTICRRIGNGMMKLRGEYQDLDLAKKAMDKSIEICENTSIIHQLGCLNYKFLKDDEAALQCFEKVKEIYGTGDIIRLKLIKEPSYDPVNEIEYWKSISSKIAKNDVLYCQIGWYYLFFKNILTLSVLNFWRVLKKDFDSFRVTKFDSYAFCVYEPVNMIKVLVNEIILLKEQDLGPDQNEDINFLEKFLQKVYEKHPEMREIKPDPNLKQRLKNTINREIAYLRKKRYGHSGNMTERRPQGNWRWHNNHEPESSGSNWRRGDEPGSEQENSRFRDNMRNVDNEEPDRGNDESGVRRNNPNFRNNTSSASGQDDSSRGGYRRQFNSYNNTRNVDIEELDRGNDESGVRRNNQNFRSNMSSASGQDGSSTGGYRRQFNSFNNTRNMDYEEPDRGNDESGVRRNNPNFRSNTSSASSQDGSSRGGYRRQFNSYNNTRNVDNEEPDRGNDESGVRRNPNFRSNTSSASGQDGNSRGGYRRQFNSYNNTRNVDNEEPDRGNDESGVRRNNQNFRSNTSGALGQDGSNRGGNRGQFNSYNNNRYDVTVTDWRRENRNRDNQS